MKFCFSETDKKYLSYGDFHFLLHKKGRIGKTAPREKKKMYQNWEKKLKNPLAGWKYPYRKFEFESSRIKEITESLIKEGKLKKTLIKKRPCYHLSEKVDDTDFLKISHQKIIDEISPNEIIIKGKRNKITYYGAPYLYPRYTPDVRLISTKLEKLAKKLENNAIKFMKIMIELASLKLVETFEKIKLLDLSEKDRKLAFLFLFAKDMNEKTLELFDKKELKTLFELIGKETTFESLFRWTGDGDLLEYIPNKYILPSKLSILLYSYQKTEEFWRSKLIIIEPQPEISDFENFAKTVSPIHKEIRDYLNMNNR